MNERIRFIFDDMPIRGLHTQLGGVWQHILQRKHYPVAIQRALGELLAAGSLLSSNLKLDGTLIVQVQGQGVLKMLVVEATSEHTVRATARWDEHVAIADDADLNTLLGDNSVFVLTVEPKDGEPWQGVVPLEGGSHRQYVDALYGAFGAARNLHRFGGRRATCGRFVVATLARRAA